MPTSFEVDHSVKVMAERLVEKNDNLSSIEPNRILFFAARGKKRAKGEYVPGAIKVLAPDMQQVLEEIYKIHLYDEFYTLDEAHQYAVLMYLLLNIDIVSASFHEGKLRKPDIHDFSYMIERFGLNWMDNTNLPNIAEGDDDPPTTAGVPTFSNETATIVVDDAVVGIVEPDETEPQDIPPVPATEEDDEEDA